MGLGLSRIGHRETGEKGVEAPGSLQAGRSIVSTKQLVRPMQTTSGHRSSASVVCSRVQHDTTEKNKRAFPPSDTGKTKKKRKSALGDDGCPLAGRICRGRVVAGDRPMVPRLCRERSAVQWLPHQSVQRGNTPPQQHTHMHPFSLPLSHPLSVPLPLPLPLFFISPPYLLLPLSFPLSLFPSLSLSLVLVCSLSVFLSPVGRTMDERRWRPGKEGLNGRMR